MSANVKYLPVNKHKIIVVQAIAVTILFHLILLFSFAYIPASEVQPDYGVKRIALLNLASGTRPEHHEIINWMEYHDPAMISRPGSNYGYSSVASQRIFRSPVSDLARKSSMEEPKAINVKSFDPLKPVKGTSFDRISHFVCYKTLAPGIREKEKAVTKAEYPKIFKEDSVLEITIPEKTVELGKEVAVGPTIIKVKSFGNEFFPRFSIISSSGSKSLDMAIVKILMENQDKIGLGKEPVSITIYWNQPKGGSQ
jgi:hypothetical protein